MNPCRAGFGPSSGSFHRTVTLDPTDPHVVSGNPDSDGYTTFQEWVADTNPTNTFSYFRITDISRGPPITVRFLSSSNRVYSLHYVTNPVEASWTAVPGQIDVPGRGGMDALGDDPYGAQQRLYRVGVRVP